MNITDLKNAVKEIDFDKEKQEQMILEIQAKKKPRRYTGILRVAAAAAVCILTIGLLSVPVRAVVNSLVRERMESVPKEEIMQITEQIQEQQTEANSSSREYTEGEKERRGSLYAKYMNGLFPTGELTLVDSERRQKSMSFVF